MNSCRQWRRSAPCLLPVERKQACVMSQDLKTQLLVQKQHHVVSVANRVIPPIVGLPIPATRWRERASVVIFHFQTLERDEQLLTTLTISINNKTKKRRANTYKYKTVQGRDINSQAIE